MRNEIATDKCSEDTQIKIRMTKDATGTDLIVTTRGASRWRMKGRRAEAAAKTMPAARAEANPVAMRERDSPTEPQNSPLPASSIKRFPASRGETRRMSCPMTTLAICHTNSQNARGQNRCAHFFRRRSSFVAPMSLLFDSFDVSR